MAGSAAAVILHVEEERTVREAIAVLLGEAGYRCAGAAHGGEALKLVTGGLRPDVLIIDPHLGTELNGADVAQMVRCALGYSPPIILLTDHPTRAELPWVTDAPIWLARKPLNPMLLLAALPGLILLSRSMREVREPMPLSAFW